MKFSHYLSYFASCLLVHAAETNTLSSAELETKLNSFSNKLGEVHTLLRMSTTNDPLSIVRFKVDTNFYNNSQPREIPLKDLEASYVLFYLTGEDGKDLISLLESNKLKKAGSRN